MRPVILLAALAIAGCTRPVEPAASGLARELAGHVAGAPQSCVSIAPNQNLRVIDAGTIVYGYGRTIYVNRLAGPCPGLEPLSTLIIQAEGGRYCRGDRVQGREPGAVVAGPTCNLQDWTPYRMP